MSVEASLRTFASPGMNPPHVLVALFRMGCFDTAHGALREAQRVKRAVLDIALGRAPCQRVCTDDEVQCARERGFARGQGPYVFDGMRPSRDVRAWRAGPEWILEAVTQAVAHEERILQQMEAEGEVWDG